MRTRAFAGRLAQTVHAYPTWSYGLQKAAGQLFGEVEGRTWRRRVREALRLAGLAVTLSPPCVGLLAARTPTITYHVVPLIVASAWPRDRWVGRRRSDPAPIGECRARRICAGHGDGDHPRSEGRSRRPDTLGNAGNRGCPRRTRRRCGSWRNRRVHPRSADGGTAPGASEPSSIRRRSRRRSRLVRGSDRSTVQVCLTCSSRSAVT